MILSVEKLTTRKYTSYSYLKRKKFLKPFPLNCFKPSIILFYDTVERRLLQIFFALNIATFIISVYFVSDCDFTDAVTMFFYY